MSDDFKDEVRAWAGDRHLPKAALDRWLSLPPSDASAILSVARQLRLRTGQLLSALDLLTEIAVREGQGAAAVLSRAELRPMLSGSGSRPERASALLEKLRELRYPRLTRTRAKLEAAVSAMRLPPGLSVLLPRDLASDELVIRLSVRSGAELNELLAALDERRGALEELAGILNGSDEI